MKTASRPLGERTPGTAVFAASSWMAVAGVVAMLIVSCDSEESRPPPPPGSGKPSVGQGSNSPGPGPVSGGDTSGGDTSGGDTSGGGLPGGTGGVTSGGTGGVFPVEVDPSIGALAVGTEGELVRLTATGALLLTLPEAVHAEDLEDIAAVGSRVWAVGSSGTILRSDDHGDQWSLATSGVAEGLTAVDVSRTAVVYAVGQAGTMLRSEDGSRFEAMGAPRVDFTGVAVEAQARFAVAVSAQGSIVQHRRGDEITTELELVDGVALRAVDMTPGGDVIVAVGDDGTWLESFDAGVTWSLRTLPTDADLHDVALTASGDLMVAVGSDGTVVNVDGLGVKVVTLRSDRPTLRAIDLDSSGRGLAVGDHGASWITDDAGLSWMPLGVPTPSDLLGVGNASFVTLH